MLPGSAPESSCLADPSPDRAIARCPAMAGSPDRLSPDEVPPILRSSYNSAPHPGGSMRRHLRTFLAGGTLAVALMGTLLSGQQASGTVPVADEFSRLHFRSIGPANMSGRISDFAVYEKN